MSASLFTPRFASPRRGSIISLAVWASTLLLPIAGPATAQAPPEPRDTTLANGLQVIVLEDHAVALATVAVAVRSGAFTQRPGEQGIAHVYEHMLFRTYKGDPSRFGEDASALKAEYNGETGEEVVFYYMILPSEKAEKAIDQLGELVTRARFKQRDLDEELPVILDELARGTSDPAGNLRRLEDRDLWGGDWYRKDVGGDSASLKRVTLARLQEYFDRYYVPNNSALIVTGDVDTQDVFRQAADRFGKWDRADDPFAGKPAAPMTPLARSTLVVSTSEAYEATIRIELQGPGLDADPGGVRAMRTLVARLGREDSPFFRDLVVNGPFRELDCDFERSRSAGTIVFEGSADVGRAADAAILLADTLDHLEGYLSEPDTASTKLQELDRALVLEVGATLAPYMADLWSKGLTLDFQRRNTDHSTGEDLVRVARTYLQGRPRVIGVIVPASLAALVRARLEAKEGTR